MPVFTEDQLQAEPKINEFNLARFLGLREFIKVGKKSYQAMFQLEQCDELCSWFLAAPPKQSDLNAIVQSLGFSSIFEKNGYIPSTDDMRRKADDIDERWFEPVEVQLRKSKNGKFLNVTAVRKAQGLYEEDEDISFEPEQLESPFASEEEEEGLGNE